MYFSKSKLGFYDNPKNYKNAPDDLVEITNEVYRNVCSNKPIGKILASDENGYPILIDHTPKTKAQLKSSELNALTTEFTKNKNLLNVAWLAAAVADGVNEDTRKASVLADIDELQTQYNSDVVALKLKYA